MEDWFNTTAIHRICLRLTLCVNNGNPWCNIFLPFYITTEEIPSRLNNESQVIENQLPCYFP